jgi:hypothetical protein
MFWIVKFFYRTIDKGAQTQIMLSVEPQLENITGKFFVNCVEKETAAKVKDDETGKWLWEKSEVLTRLNE